MTHVTLAIGLAPMTHRYNASRRLHPHGLKKKSLHTTDSALATTGERRRLDRRQRTFTALLRGSFTPRRRVPRRGTEASFASVDWHHPQWLAVTLLILILCCADAILTITLLERGAYELNPIMAHLIHRSALGFAVAKIGLTSGGVVLLTLIAGTRVFGRIPVGFVLYSVLAGYVALIGYELYLLDRTANLPPLY